MKIRVHVSAKHDIQIPTSNTTMQSSLLTAKDVKRILSVSARTVANLVANGSLPFIKIGRSTRFEPADVAQFKTARRVNARQ